MANVSARACANLQQILAFETIWNISKNCGTSGLVLISRSWLGRPPGDDGRQRWLKLKHCQLSRHKYRHRLFRQLGLTAEPSGARPLE